MAFPLILAGASLVLGTVASFSVSKAADALRVQKSKTPEFKPLTAAELRELEFGLREEALIFDVEFKRSQAQEAQLAKQESLLQRQEELRAREEEARLDRELRVAELRFQLEAKRQLAAEQAERDRLLFEEKSRAATDAANLAAAVRTQESRDRRFAAFAASLPAGFQPAIDENGNFTAIPPGGGLTPGDVAEGTEPLPFASQQRSLVSPLSFRTIPGVFVPPGKTPAQVLQEQFGVKIGTEAPRRTKFGGERARGPAITGVVRR